MISTILLLIILVAVIGAVPVWPHSKSWGYYPAGGGTLVLVIVLLLVLTGRI